MVGQAEALSCSRRLLQPTGANSQGARSGSGWQCHAPRREYRGPPPDGSACNLMRRNQHLASETLRPRCQPPSLCLACASDSAAPVRPSARGWSARLRSPSPSSYGKLDAPASPTATTHTRGWQGWQGLAGLGGAGTECRASGSRLQAERHAQHRALPTRQPRKPYLDVQTPPQVAQPRCGL